MHGEGLWREPDPHPDVHCLPRVCVQGEGDDKIAKMALNMWSGAALFFAWLGVLVTVLVLVRTLPYDHRCELCGGRSTDDVIAVYACLPKAPHTAVGVLATVLVPVHNLPQVFTFKGKRALCA